MRRIWVHGLIVLASLAWAPLAEAQRRPRRTPETAPDAQRPDRPRRNRRRRNAAPPPATQVATAVTPDMVFTPDAETTPITVAPLRDPNSEASRVVVLPGNPYPEHDPPPPELPGNPYSEPTPAPAPAPSAPAAVARRPGRSFGSVSEEDILEALRNAPIQALNNVGNTSVNLRVDLPGDIDGSYKPSEERHPEHYRAEIAAFRLNQLLGLERVPPAVFRRVPRASLPNGERYGIFFTEEQSRGAMIYWVPVLRSAGISSPEAFEAWMTQLTVGTRILPRDRARAEEISTLLVFDFLIANWDRWNGLNTLQDGSGHLVYRDNNGGFQEPLSATRYNRVLRFLHRTQRFSRRVIERARALTLESLQRSIAPDAVGDEALLNDVQLRAVLRRRDTLLAYVNELVARYGEAEVYAFP